MRPEDALAAARRLADEHAGTTLPTGGLEVERSTQPSDDQLLQWSVVEPDLREVRSTRPGPAGRVLTALKQTLLRLMGQYHAQVLSTQNRINVHLALRSTVHRDEARILRDELDSLHARVRGLERELERERSRRSSDAPSAAGQAPAGRGDDHRGADSPAAPLDPAPERRPGRPA